MSLTRVLIIVCLILYAVFQLYQVYSSFTVVFIEYGQHYDYKIKTLTGFNIVGLTLSSIFLIAGSFKSSVNLLLLALIYLFYKVGFFFWYIGDFYNLTIGCDDKTTVCDSNRLWIIYKHLGIFGKNSFD